MKIIVALGILMIGFGFMYGCGDSQMPTDSATSTAVDSVKNPVTVSLVNSYTEPWAGGESVFIRLSVRNNTELIQRVYPYVLIYDEQGKLLREEVVFGMTGFGLRPSEDTEVFQSVLNTFSVDMITGEHKGGSFEYGLKVIHEGKIILYLERIKAPLQ